MNGIPEVLLTDEGIHVVKYSIESFKLHDKHSGKRFFRVKVGELYYDITEGISSFELLYKFLMEESGFPKG